MLDHRVKVSRSVRPPAPRPGATELTVLVADDHPGVVGHLRGLLTAAPGITVVAQASTGPEAIELARRHRPDVLVLDLELPDGGIAVIRELTETAVLVYTARADDDSVLTAMRAGARGYLLKDADDPAGEHMVRAVRGVAAGEAIFGQSIAARVLQLLANPEPTAPLPDLTDREAALLDLLAEGYGNAAIAARLQLAPKTVSNLISTLVAKLGVSGREAAVSAGLRSSAAARNERRAAHEGSRHQQRPTGSEPWAP
ncbi:MAG TPA: response regulator transcription factor [Actinophytocola sp.]|uniref:response regulator transcription factor n=1 Tax=Actinophytocola sp. TaxID=1872138 RepID=UPI002DBE53BB|nr:response regulator transcription factor [Actinophytocola sp.]HEU5474091.1 response regulator transcription factor [Actinophytocola sp.]